ncbi:SDR family NAD(P)-dependent oxidoreductase [Dyella solisilvae]|uniref:SDR family NAD(P)-dependent oxidoreductase n=1 Tax=Dyella solisilvae TaxID=1920168 RepID=A0A370KAP4_9GAMM|nr:SDR family oxidoreductase [Dyella solisilvae]RDI99733.1 SDR family NAD(P)-dependent oxidoreductase [Dyella solisilvae]
MKKTVLITGTSSGIGQAAVRRFAEAGWNVVTTMRSPARAVELAWPEQVLVTRLDVQDRASIHDAIEAGIARFGRIDALVNNAGFGQYGLFEATPEDKIREQFDVNVFGVMEVIRAMLPHFRQHRAGVIVNVSSGAGMFTLPMISLYCASKFALEGFSESLSYELASQGVAVKLVIPHGGVSSTRFGERSGREYAGHAAIADYDAFVAATNQAFDRMRAARMMTSDEVAQVIYEAATDGSDRLRYLVGDDARGFVKARRELPEEGYIDFMRAHFRTEE